MYDDPTMAALETVVVAFCIFCGVVVAVLLGVLFYLVAANT